MMPFMARPIALVVLLVLLVQNPLAAWAAATMAVPAAPAAAEAMPCHGDDAGSTQAAAQSRAASHMACCDEGQSCGNCAAACVAAPALPVAAATLAEYLEAHYASVWHSDAILIRPPLDLLRPPITLLR